MNEGIFIITYILVIGTAVYLGIKIARKKIPFSKKYPRVFYCFICGWLMLIGGIAFPLSLNVLFGLSVCCFITSIAFARLYGAGKWKRVCLTTLLFSSAGLLCRYVLEYREAYNTYNFIVWNVLLYLGFVVGMVVGGYQLVSREKL